MSFVFISAAVGDVMVVSMQYLAFYNITTSEQVTEKVLKLGSIWSWVCWTVGFFIHTFVQFLYCRKPPHFDIHWAEIQYGVVASSGIRFLGGALGLVGACVSSSDLHDAITIVAFLVLLVGNGLQPLAVI